MNHEDRGHVRAGHAGEGDSEGRLTFAEGRSPFGGRPAAATLRYRLKRSIELFVGRDGSVRLLRLGAGDDLIVTETDADEIRLLEVLAAGFHSERELATAIDVSGAARVRVARALEELVRAGLVEARAHPRRLPISQRERYDRQLIYFADLAAPGQDPETLQMRLGDSTVAILGCGGLGAWAASGLAGAGVGRLVLIDDDRVELSNLNRQLLYAESQLGQLKVLAARDALRAHNREIDVVPVARRIRRPQDMEDLLGLQPDLVIATADWPPHDLPRWVNRACLQAGVPWIGAGQFPPRVRVGPMVIPGKTACHACLEAAVREEAPLYDEVATSRSRRCMPDPSVGAVSGVVGSLLAAEAVHLLLGRFRPSSAGAALLLDLQTMQLRREVITRRRDCRECSLA